MVVAILLGLCIGPVIALFLHRLDEARRVIADAQDVLDHHGPRVLVYNDQPKPFTPVREVHGLFLLDVLPPKAAVTIELRGTRGFLEAIRFRAKKGRRVSEWSGWFEYEGDPIVLQWEAFGL